MECIGCVDCSYKVRTYLLKGRFDMHESFGFLQGNGYHTSIATHNTQNNGYHIQNEVFYQGCEWWVEWYAEVTYHM